MAAGAEHSRLQRAARTTLGRLPCGAEPRRARRSGAPGIPELSPRGKQPPGGGRGQREGWQDSGKDAGTDRRMPGQREECLDSRKDGRTVGRMPRQREGCRGSGKDAEGREGAKLRALPGREAQPAPRKFGGRSIASSSSSPPLPSHRHDSHSPSKRGMTKCCFLPL